MDSDGFIKNLQKAKAKLAWLADRLDPDAEEYQNCMKHIAKLDSTMEQHKITTEKKKAVGSSSPGKTERHSEIQQQQEQSHSQSTDDLDCADDEWVELDAEDEGYVVI
ncbi:hypothetical protein MGN70_012991 [Eutypa lata]|uniref:Uncharacterized protein n=1 Tax=Eutypa lata (strain UCR-EL1) TaxID=1287681 RepID=M7SMD2_EUTLA|nr:hypothetical protein UCREL1_7673 [Eutypa lata UCREL1]KAI1246094.1 hypothetical protein MGN70_012991 [Eutypa lata]